MSSYARANLRKLMKKQKENSHEGITWSEMGKQNVQAEKVYRTETYGGRAFSSCAPRLWNQLPPALRSNMPIDVFKKQLKTFLFD